MKLIDSTSAKVQNTQVRAIVSSNSSFRQFVCYAATTVASAISGTIGLVKNGIGGLTLSGTCDYTGPTQINTGLLTLTGASTLNGVISGSGSLAKSGSLAVTLGGNNTYSGGTNYSPSAATGSITFSSGNVFGTGLVTCSGIACQIITGNSVTIPNNFQLNSGSVIQYRVNTQTTILNISGNIDGSGGLNKTSTGQLRLNGTLNYTGSTTITAGTLRAIKTTGASTATASFTTGLSVSFNVAPPSGTTDFRFFQGLTTNSYPTVTLVGVPAGTTATYTSATSTLSVTVP
jgi:autotransporter-associated beta strand protein